MEERNQFVFYAQYVYSPSFIQRIAEGLTETLPELADEFPGQKLKYLMCEMDYKLPEGIVVVDNKPRKGRAVILTIEVVLIPEEMVKDNDN